MRDTWSCRGGCQGLREKTHQVENDRITADHPRIDGTLARACELCHQSAAHTEKIKYAQELSLAGHQRSRLLRSTIGKRTVIVDHARHRSY